MAPPTPGVEGAEKLAVPPAIKVRSLAAEAVSHRPLYSQPRGA